MAKTSSVLELVERPPQGDAERKQTWERFIQICIVSSGRIADTGYREWSDQVKREVEGGACPVCHREYTKVWVDNRLAFGTYYRPVCRCEDRPERKLWVRCCGTVRDHEGGKGRCHNTILISRPEPEDAWTGHDGIAHYKAFYCERCAGKRGKTPAEEF